VIAFGDDESLGQIISKAALHSIDYSRWAEVFQAPLIGLIFYWYQFPPPPGYAVAWLAAAGVVMAVRAEYFTVTEKVIWILIEGAFVIFEIQAISRDRDEHDKEQAAIRWQDDFNRKQERRQFASTMEAMENLLGLSKNNLKTASRMLAVETGGHTFCYVDIRVANGIALVSLLGEGKEPLSAVTIQVIDGNEVQRLITANQLTIEGYRNAERDFSFPLRERYTGYIRNLYTFMPGTAPMQFSIFMRAINGVFVEKFRLHLVDKQWVRALRVEASYYDDTSGVWDFFDATFPRSTLEGDKDWHAGDRLKRIITPGN
jgi:hypothetical protein